MENLAEKYSYLNYLEKKLDDQQIKVCCRTDNSVVAAGAGSGKTQVLATRFAWLCMEFDDLKASEILTLTYTKKAAAEMYLRIYQTLALFASAPADQVPERQRKNAQRALDDFANVHIQTTDSYCSSIVRQAANRYGIRPDFTNGSAKGSNFSNLVLSFVLRNKENPAVLHFSKAGAIQDFAFKLFGDIVIKCTSLAIEKDFFKNSLELQKEHIIEMMKQFTDEKKSKSVPQLVNELDTIINSEEGINEIKFSKGKTSYLGLYDLVENRVEFPAEQDLNRIFNDNDPDALKKARDFADWVDGLCIRTYNSKKPAYEAMVVVVNELKDVRKDLLPVCSYLSEYFYIKELFCLLDEFTLDLNQNKRTSGALEFKDVSEMALKILIEQEDIRQQEKHAYKKIMIDEFQDNNGKNRDMLFLLSEKPELFTRIEGNPNDSDALHQALKQNIVKDKLFFVGDEKQSIYKFRGADVAVFNELKTDLEEINGPEANLHMIHNYRSTPELLSCFNQIFGAWIPKGSEYVSNGKKSVFEVQSDCSYEACYPEKAIAKAVDKDTHKEMDGAVLTESNVPVHCKVVIENKEFKDGQEEEGYLSSLDQESYSIAKTIRSLADKEGKNYGNFAILDKSRTNRANLCSWLERFEIPYELDQQSNIFADGPVNDIYNFLRICVYPSDMTSFAAYLCSPFCGFSAEQMEQIISGLIYHGGEDFVFESFHDSYNSHIYGKFGGASQIYKSYAKAAQFYQETREKALHQPITDTLNTLWFDCGYRYETMLNSNLDIFSSQYDFLFELARQADSEGNSIAWFIDQLGAIRDFEAAELDASEVSFPLEKKNAVQIMTIHKSKGLQFNHVFVLGCMSSAKKDSSQSYFYDEKYGVCIKPLDGNGNHFFDRQKETADMKTKAEFRRLIYVAITRAVKDVYIYGSINIKKDGSMSLSDTDFITAQIYEYYPKISEDEFGNHFAEGAPFDLEKLKPVNKLIYREFKNDKDLIRLRTERKFEFESCNWQSVATPVLESNHATPSSLELSREDSAEIQKREPSGKDLYPEFDDLMDKLTAKKTGFGFESFGTLAHSFLEKNALGVPFEVIESQEAQKLNSLDKSYHKKLFEICELICKNFEKTEYGKGYSDAKENERIHYAEMAFKTMQNGKIMTGTVDLFYENPDGSLTIVDYKTDKEIVPEKYIPQQRCYQEALSVLFEIPVDRIHGVLYFTRYNHVENIF